jgi:DNA mismatch repair protein MutS2
MISIHPKTLKDLEFPEVLNRLKEHCITELGKEAVMEIIPFNSVNKILQELNYVNEYYASFQNDNTFPNHGFDPITSELKLLNIENTYLEVSGLQRISRISLTVNAHLKFLKKFNEYYPELYQLSQSVDFNTIIVEEIDAIVDRFGEIKDSASPLLAELRRSILKVKSKINSSFSAALNTYRNLDYLDDIRESVVDNRRVLAVKSMYRRKVNGAIMGGSKTGSIVYIEPEATLQYSRELNNLEYDEKEEIIRILKEITDFLRLHLPLLNDYQDYLIKTDLIYSKSKYAQTLNAVLPQINTTREMHLVDAYHPLLLETNNRKGEVTFPQTISLSKEERIIVISGPNAGGKSITLKTVGLIQLMLQSGMLVPVHERSSMCFFDRILSDIGDNQSIENHLSTYSYRLKQMNYFLKKCQEKTLFLIDEFGTGSDPELGGALAESFLEVFYERGAYGIITTHYSNLKLLANELPHMQNGNMLFNEQTLEPMFQLVVGQAGSSFTFEVAQKNGIPYSLINKSKKKIERSKVRLDATIAKLQKERSKLERTERSLKANEIKKLTEAEQLEDAKKRVQSKLESYQQLYDSNQRLIYLGQKFNDLAENFYTNKRKRELMNELFKLVQIENSKRKKVDVNQQLKLKKEQQRIQKEAGKKIAVIRKEKKKAKEKEVKAAPPKPVLKLGDRVRMFDGKAVGTIDSIEKNKAVVNYGVFTTNISLEQLELVESSKK